MISTELRSTFRDALGAGASQLAELFEKHPEVQDEPDFASLLAELSIDYDDPELVDVLVKNGADIHAPLDPDSPEGLIYDAVASERPRCVEYLLKMGAVVNHEVNGVTRCLSLSTAVIDGNLEIVELLVRHGAKVNATFNGENALGFALKYEHTEIADYLKSHGAKTPGELGLAWPEDEDVAGPESQLAHIEEHIGTPRSVSVIEVVPGEPPITLHVVDLPDEGLQVVITEGMSSLPMTVPEGGEEFQYAELVLKLRDDWPLDEESVRDPANSWPLGWLRKIARYPHENQT